MVSILTGDIVNSSKLTKEQLTSVLKKLEQFLEMQSKLHSDMEFELFRGDSVQIKLNDPQSSLMLATQIRIFVLSLESDIRISIGLGNINEPGDRLNTSTGQAFVFSGHSLDNMKTKSRFVFKSASTTLDSDIAVATESITAIINSWTLNRTKTVLYMMLGTSREDVCKKFNIKNATLSKTLRSANYSTLKMILGWAENKINSYLNVC
jgi:hypothetical protein